MEQYWDPDEVLANCVAEREALGIDSVKLAQKRMAENADVAVTRVIHTIKYSPDDKLAFDAAKYLIERVMGRIPEFGGVNAREDLVDLVYELAEVNGE